MDDDTEDEVTFAEEEEATDVRWLAELALSEADYNPEERGGAEVIALINIAFDKYATRPARYCGKTLRCSFIRRRYGVTRRFSFRAHG